MNRSLLLWIVCALPLQVVASDAIDQQDAVTRIQQAVAKANIFELPSFVMKATVQVNNRGNMVDGKYQLLWNGPDQWREEIALPGYAEVQIAGKGTIWLQRSSELVPFAVYYLRQALPFGSNVVSAGSSSLIRLNLSRKIMKKQRERKEHGKKLTCFETEDEQKYRSEVCVNDATGTVANTSGVYVEDDFQPLGSKVFPRVLGALEDGKTLAKVNITELTTPAHFTANTFTQANGVSPQPGCMNPLISTLVKKVPPHYPEQARMQRVQGTVKLDVLIGLDGVPRVNRAIESPSPDLEDSARRAVENWRYDPATCNGEAVPLSTIVQVNYTLSQN